MRNNHIDVAKGIGIILVIAGHLFTYQSIISMMIFSFHMPLFFFLSGMLYKKNEGSLFLFLKEKIKKLCIPFFFFLLIGLPFALVFPFQQETLTYYNIVSDLYLAQPDHFQVGQIWFLACLLHVEIFYHILYRNLLSKITWPRAILLFLIVAIIGKEIVFINSFFPFYRLPIKLDSAFMGLFFFGIGHYFYQFIYETSDSNYEKYVFAFLGIICSPLNGWSNLANVSYNYLPCYIFFALSGIVFSLWLARKLQSIKFLRFVGKNSMEIFALHSFGIYFWCKLLSYLLNYDIISGKNVPTIYAVVGTVIILLVCCFEVNFRHSLLLQGHK